MTYIEFIDRKQKARELARELVDLLMPLVNFQDDEANENYTKYQNQLNQYAMAKDADDKEHHEKMMSLFRDRWQRYVHDSETMDDVVTFAKRFSR